MPCDASISTTIPRFDLLGPKTRRRIPRNPEIQEHHHRRSARHHQLLGWPRHLPLPRLLLRQPARQSHSHRARSRRLQRLPPWCSDPRGLPRPAPGPRNLPRQFQQLLRRHPAEDCTAPVLLRARREQQQLLRGIPGLGVRHHQPVVLGHSFQRLHRVCPAAGFQAIPRRALHQQQQLHAKDPNRLWLDPGALPHPGQQQVHGPDPKEHWQRLLNADRSALPEQPAHRLHSLRDRVLEKGHRLRRRGQLPDRTAPVLTWLLGQDRAAQLRRELPVRRDPGGCVLNAKFVEPIAVEQLLQLHRAVVSEAREERSAGREDELHRWASQSEAVL